MTREEMLAIIRQEYLVGDALTDNAAGDVPTDEELLVVEMLAETGWPDWEHWLAVYNRLHDRAGSVGGSMTSAERDRAIKQLRAAEDNIGPWDVKP